MVVTYSCWEAFCPNTPTFGRYCPEHSIGKKGIKVPLYKKAEETGHFKFSAQEIGLPVDSIETLFSSVVSTIELPRTRVRCSVDLNVDEKNMVNRIWENVKERCLAKMGWSADKQVDFIELDVRVAPGTGHNRCSYTSGAPLHRDVPVRPSRFKSEVEYLRSLHKSAYVFMYFLHDITENNGRVDVYKRSQLVPIENEKNKARVIERMEKNGFAKHSVMGEKGTLFVMDSRLLHQPINNSTTSDRFMINWLVTEKDDNSDDNDSSESEVTDDNHSM